MGKQASKLKGYDNVFATNLRDLMAKKQITQETLAEQVGCSRQAISQYMDGSTIPNVDKLLGIAKFFNISVDYLLGLTNSETTDKDVRFICDYFETDTNTILGLKKLLQNNNKYKDELKGIINSSHFSKLLNYIYQSFYLKKSLGQTLMYELDKVRKLSQESGEYLFNEYDTDGYSSDFNKERKKLENDIDLNEYRAQKELLALMNIFSGAYDETDFFSIEDYENYICDNVPSQNFFDSLTSEIESDICFINYEIDNYIDEHYAVEDEIEDGEQSGNNSKT